MLGMLNTWKSLQGVSPYTLRNSRTIFDLERGIYNRVMVKVIPHMYCFVIELGFMASDRVLV